MQKLFDLIIKLLIEGANEEAILKTLDADNLYKFYKPEVRELSPKHRSKMSPETKTEVFMREGIASALRCYVCGGFLHSNSMNIDHVQEVENNGVGNADNGLLTHFYCNSIKKDLKKMGFQLYGHNQPPLQEPSPS